jgi:hypothetical protein
MRTIASGGIALSIVALSTLPAHANELQDLKRQVERLLNRIDKVEQGQRRAPKNSSAAEVTRGHTKGSFMVPGTNTSIKFGGWMRGDLMFDAAGDPGDLFSVGSIPLQSADNSSRSNKHFRAQGRNSRLNLTVLTPTGDGGNVKGFMEFDFRGGDGTETVSNSGHLRLRHAYVDFPMGENGRVLVGQSWSNFFSLGTTAPAVSWVGSEGGIFVRQAQLRYTHNLGYAKFGLSIENPDGNVGNAPSGDNDLNDQYPDVIAKMSFKGAWGRGDIGWLNRFLVIDRGGVDEVEYGWGLTANAAFKLGKQDTLYVQGVGGRGLGRYLNAGFQSSYLVNNKIELSDQVGFRLGYGHVFNKQVSMNVFGGMERNDPATGFTGTPNYKLWSVHANMFFKPFPKTVPNLSTGIEYIHGERETTSGGEGETDRIHFMTRFKF